jgi:hypothetical protein
MAVSLHSMCGRAPCYPFYVADTNCEALHARSGQTSAGKSYTMLGMASSRLTHAVGSRSNAAQASCAPAHASLQMRAARVLYIYIPIGACAGPAESQHDLQSEVRGVIPRVLEYLFRTIKHQETTVCTELY